MAKTNVEALKMLWAKIKNDGSTAADLAAETTAEVIEAIANAYTGEPTQELGELTLLSVAGTEVGKTSITVTGQGSGSLVYKTNYRTLPEYGDVLTTGWTAWNGTDEIAAEDGTFITICEIDSSNKAVAGGDTMVNINVG